MEQFDSMLSPIIDQTLGQRCRSIIGYQYSEIIRSLMSVYFCGGSCVEDVTSHLMRHLSYHPTLRTCSSDTILRAIKELTQENISYTSDKGKTYDFNTADKLNALLIKALVSTGELNEVETYDVSRRIRAARKEQCMMSMAAPKAQSLADALKMADMGFSEAVLKLIDASGKKDSEIYKKAHISKQHFSKIRNNPHYQPTKPTAIALALALELNLEDTKELIGRAGYTLTRSSKFDLIIQYFIEQGNFDIVEINIALYEFDQTLLGV